MLFSTHIKHLHVYKAQLIQHIIQQACNTKRKVKEIQFHTRRDLYNTKNTT